MAQLRFVCWNLERNGAGDPEIRRAAAETLRRLQPDIVFRQEMFRADERGHTIFNEQCRELDMQGVLGPGACTAILFNPGGSTSYVTGRATEARTSCFRPPRSL